MVIKMDRIEAKKILISHLERIFPNTLITDQGGYSDFEFDVSEKEEKKAE